MLFWNKKIAFLPYAALMLASSTTTAVVRAEDDSFTVMVGEDNLVDSCVTDYNPEGNVDYFPVKYTKPTIESYGDVDINGNVFIPHNTTDYLSIEYFRTYKIVTNKHQDPPKKYLLYQCGTEIPSTENAEEFDLIVPVPHKGGLALTQTPQIPYVELLGLRTEVIAYIGNPIWVTSPCISYMLGPNATPGRGTSIETVYDSNFTIQEELINAWRQEHPDAIIVSGPTNNVVGDQVVVASATQERTNVATFDWIAFYAAFYNLEGESNRIAAEYQESYDCSSDVAKAIVAEQREREAQELPPEPKVLWANLITWQDLGWSVAECPTWDNAYYCEYATHCGAQIISRPDGVGYNRTWGSPTVYWYLSDEEFLEMGKDADVFIYTGSDWDTIYGTHNSTLDQIKAVKAGQVFDTLGQGPSAWNEQRYAEYDIVGLDMCDVVGHTPTSSSHGSGGTEPHTRRWFRNVFTEPVGSMEECDVDGGEISKPFVPPRNQQEECVRPTTTTTTTTTANEDEDNDEPDPSSTSEGTDGTGSSSEEEESTTSGNDSESSSDDKVTPDDSSAASAAAATTTSDAGFSLMVVFSFAAVFWL